MGKGSSKAPDYAGAAEKTAQGNMEMLRYQTDANRPSMYTPWGSSTWSNEPAFDQAAYDAAMAAYTKNKGTWIPGGEQWVEKGKPGNGFYQELPGRWSGNAGPAPDKADFTSENWVNRVELTPAQQAALDDQQNIQKNQSSLAQTLQGQVAKTMGGGFNAPQLGTYMKGVPGIDSSFDGFTPHGVGGVNKQSFNPNSFTGGNRDVLQTFGGGPQINLNAPRFSDATAAAGAKAAYDGSTALLEDQWEQDTSALDNKLRMQGLTPGTEAYNNAAQNLSRVQAQQQNQLANQAVLTGNDMANKNYASSLAGYEAGNDARGQQFDQNAATFGLTNDARTQNLMNDMTLFGANLQGQGAYNTAQGQAFNQSLAGYGADVASQQASNEAQQQAWQQALANYQAAYGAAYTNYTQPLNSMNAVLTGQQVQNPSFNGFAQAGYTPGPDYSGAASALGQWNSAQDAQAQAGFGSMLGAVGTIGAAFI